jgi:hypothetical protein
MELPHLLSAPTDGETLLGHAKESPRVLSQADIDVTAKLSNTSQNRDVSKESLNQNKFGW